ncbi:MAG: universal stress protein [Rhodobacteraceae bacterium]|nr:universal stress protein [Paracoccaceae bacterium]
MSGIVLCALDISQPDRERPVLRRAAQIAALDGARLDVITVVPDMAGPMIGAYFSPELHDRIIADAQQALTDLVDATLGAGADDRTRHIVASGTVHDEILRVAEAEHAQVIIIGAHRPALRDYLLGPSAAHVVRHSNCSVFVVREG